MGTENTATMEQTEISKDRNNFRLKDYHSFKHRESHLDVLIEKTKINQSEFKGFYNLIVTIMILYVFTLPIYNYLNKGYFFKLKMLQKMFKDLQYIILVWPLFHFWTYFSYLQQLLILKGFPKLFISLFEIISQLGIFGISSYICLKYDLCTSQLIFTVSQCIIHFFKMNSYSKINRDYRLDYLLKKKVGETPNSSYPNNINFSNFFYFLRAPVFIYQESYPRTTRLRYNYFILKSMKAFFCLILVYNVYSEHIEPVMPTMLKYSLLELLFRLYFPIFVFCLILFYLIFECLVPAYAELATFGDREFYDDWWNSTDFEEFNRKWNKMVHMFLYMHVYLECINQYKLRPYTSKLITFLISAIMHEYCLCVIIRLFRPYMTILMMFQIPLIHYGKRYLKNSTMGNYLFWFGIVIGNSLIFILYYRSYVMEYGFDH